MSWNEREQEDTQTYKVLVNDEEQYSIWPARQQVPAGWAEVGPVGGKEECLAYVREVWADMRPLSLRRRMEESEQSTPAPPAPPDGPEPPGLVERLSAGTHPVEVDLRPEKSAGLFREALGRDFVNLRFTGTRGGTGFGVKLDQRACDLSGADFENGVGTVRLEGDLTLDYVPVRCVAEIDVRSLRGSGRLVRI
jgi:uncharacterized protein YbdZ (MbtH family)